MTRIVLHTMAQAHTFDLGVELQKTGHLTRLFSCYPKQKLIGRGLDGRFLDSFPLPFLAWMGWRRIDRSTEFMLRTEAFPKRWIDRYAARRLPECDLFIGTSSTDVAVGRVAKSRGAYWLCDRPCSHIQVQDELLRDEFAADGRTWPGISSEIIDRELAGYEEADGILIASQFSERSFLAKGVAAEKLWRIPYGVDLTLFRPRTRRPHEGFSVLFVAQVTARKGVRYLLDAFDQLKVPGKKLHLVGTFGDEGKRLLAPYAGRDDIVVHGRVPQGELPEWYSNADIMVLPSVEDGFPLVVAQTMACRCPVIVSDNVGAADIVEEGVNGFVCPTRDVTALRERMAEIAESPARQEQMAEAALATARTIGGWADYARAIRERFEGAVR